MPRLDLIPRQRTAPSRGSHLHALFASCAFHSLLLGILIGLTVLYRLSSPPIKNGARPGGASLTLSTLALVSPPVSHPAPVPVTSTTPAMPSIKPATKIQPSKTGVPTLLLQPPMTAQVPATRKPSADHSTLSLTPVTAAKKSRQAPAASASSYTPGPRELPQPPYPQQAWDLQQTGTVVLNVEFDARGNVARVEVTESSGVAILDSSTRSFIRSHWHCPALAGQVKSETVQYKLD